jgi:hypothetical protein
MSKSKKIITSQELRHARWVTINLHDKLKEGYAIEGELLVDVINAMINLLHDVIESAEKHNVTLSGSKVVETRL